jgi:hypothetical protein
MVTKLFEKIYYKEHGEMEQTCFSLYIQYIESDPIEESLFWVMSDCLVEEMLADFNTLLSPKLIFTTPTSDPNRKYLEELLDFIAEQILADPLYAPFFYPEFFFDREHNVRPEICRQFNDARIEVRNGIAIINYSNPLHLFYIDQLIRIPKKFLIEKRFSVERISRKNFEMSLVDFQLAEEYVEIYSVAERFKLIRNRQKMPEYYVALDGKNQPILVIAALYDEDY